MSYEDFEPILDGSFPDDVDDDDPETEQTKIERWDFVDNSIHELIKSLNPSKTEIEWNGTINAEIREVLVKYFVDELKVCTEDEFYP